MFKLIFFLIGLYTVRIYGPGAIIAGLVLGHAFDVASKLRREKKLEQREGQASEDSLLFSSTFALLAKLAKIDGAISKEEIEAVEYIIKDVFQLKKKQRKQAIAVFRGCEEFK